MKDNVLGKRLAELRNSNGCTRATLAELLQTHVTNYDKYEYGKQEPSLDKLVELCKFYGVSADYLLGLDDNATKKPSNS